MRSLLAYPDEPPQFSETERRALITAINRAKILDPACVSGAFPMGALHRLVFLLHKPPLTTRLWKQKQKGCIIGEKGEELERDRTIAEQVSD